MLKSAVRRGFGSLGVHVASADRLGLEMERDCGRLYDPREVRCVLDVGANVGQSAIRFAGAFPSAQIYCFEPVPQTFASLRGKTQGIDRIEVFNRAMGGKRGSATIFTSGDSLTSTMAPGTGAAAASRTAVQVEVETIDGFCADRKIERIDLLKIDVEGFEMQVLDGAAGLLGRQGLRFLYVECDFAPNAETPHTNFMTLHERLASQGYCLVCFYPESFSLKYGSCQGNALFACRALLPEAAPGRVKNIY